MLKVTVTDRADAANCPIRDVLDRVGDKWSVLIILILQEGEMRFNALKREIGDISQRVLTSTLRSLEADGYVKREVFPTSPPKVVYALTDQGRDFLVQLGPLVDWAKANHDAIRAKRSAFAQIAR